MLSFSTHLPMGSSISMSSPGKWSNSSETITTLSSKSNVVSKLRIARIAVSRKKSKPIKIKQTSLHTSEGSSERLRRRWWRKQRNSKQTKEKSGARIRPSVNSLSRTRNESVGRSSKSRASRSSAIMNQLRKKWLYHSGRIVTSSSQDQMVSGSLLFLSLLPSEQRSE